MVKRALLIGINYIGSDNQLEGCLNDETNMYNMLVRQFKFNEVRLLKDDIGSACRPTRQNILTGIDWLVREAKPGDHLVFCYSGHGSSEPDKNGDEKDGQDETICPVDFDQSGMILDDLLKQELVNRVPSGVTLYCHFDSCHSQSILDLRFSVTSNVRTNSFSLTYDTHYAATQGNVICLSGCEDSQTSADTVENGQSCGALTWAFLEVMKSNHFDIEWGPMLLQIRKLLKERGYDQMPQLSFGNTTRLDGKFCVC